MEARNPKILGKPVLRSGVIINASFWTSNLLYLDRNVSAKFESQRTAYNALLKSTKVVSEQWADAQSNILLQSVAEVALNGIGWKLEGVL